LIITCIDITGEDHERLLEEHVRRGWSQQKLADEPGIAVVTMNRWERGKQQPTGYYRLKLTTLFSKSAEELGLVEGQTEVVSPVYAEEPQENENDV
jgi:transcriptional regulator with XRE-family HTH domain